MSTAVSASASSQAQAQAHRQLAREVEGIKTEVVVQRFADRTLVLVTQLGKVGSLIQTSIPPTAHLSLPTPSSNPDSSPLPEPPTSIRLTPLLGAAPDQRTGTLQTLYVSQIATIVWVTDSAATGEEIVERRNVIVGLALKRNTGSGSGDGGEEAALTEGERRMFAGVMTLVRDVLDLGR